MSDMTKAKAAFPVRHAELIDKYISLEFGQIISRAAALSADFCKVFMSLTQEEREAIRLHFSGYLCDQSGWALSKHNILFLFFLRECFAGWHPKNKMSSKRILEMIRNISSYKTAIPEILDIEGEATRTLCGIVRRAVAANGMDAFLDGGSDVNYLMNITCNGIGEEGGSDTSASDGSWRHKFINMMRLDERPLFSTDVAASITDELVAGWGAIRGECLAGWTDCLSSGRGRHFNSYIDMMPPATRDEDFFASLWSEFFRRIGDQNGFRNGASPDVWVSCLQKFHAKHDWREDVKGRWQDIRSTCLARWKRSLAEFQLEHSFFNPARFVDTFAPSKSDEEWSGWLVGEFVRRIGQPDGFRNSASIEAWIDCLRKFPAWSNWSDGVRRHWRELRGPCLVRWKHSLTAQKIEHQLFEPIEFLELFAPAKGDAEWLDWAAEEFARQLGRSDGFKKGASPDVWVNCLMKFPAWNDWDEAVRTNWHKLRVPCFTRWKSALNSSREEHSIFDPARFLETFAPGKGDKEWLDWSVSEFSKRMAVSDGFRSGASAYGWKRGLELFECWDNSVAKRFLEIFGSQNELLSFQIIRRMLLPSSQLTASSRVCIALVLLMWAHDEFAGMRDRPSEHKAKEFDAQKEEIEGLAHGPAALWLFTRLQDLPTRHYNHRSVWSDFGPDEKAAWRAEIAKYVGDQVDVRHGLIEFLLWQTTAERFRNEIYSEMELLALCLCLKDVDIWFLETLQPHPSRLVQVRSAALLARLGQISEPDPFVPLPDDGVTASAAHQALSVVAGGEYSPTRTWMQDGTVERIIYDGVRRVEAVFCEEYEREWRLEEEMHVSALLSKVQGALAGVNGVLDALALQGIGVAPRIDFSFRQIPKHEEGASGIGGHSFATDVAFMVRVTDAGRLVTHRATLVQCKKLNANDTGAWRPSFDIKRDQCDDLIAQTESSFYMFLSPAFVGREVWMTPARLVRNLSDLHGTKGTLPHAPTYYASRSFAHWLTYDLFGLWIGDEKGEVVAKAEGGKPGYSPRFVVSVVIHRNPTHDEAPNRPRSRKWFS